MSAALPAAFGGRGLAVGGAYAVMQIGRSVFAVAGLRGEPLQRNFQRILAWCVVSGALAVAGGLVAGHARELLWLAAVGGGHPRRAGRLLDARAGPVQHPGLDHRGQSLRRTLPGVHPDRAGRVDRGDRGHAVPAARRHRPGGQPRSWPRSSAASGLWWLYFHRSAEEGAQVIARSADPGRLGRSAYHLIHPVMVAGIIVVAAGDQLVLDRPGEVGSAPVSAMVLGGTALFLIGHAAVQGGGLGHVVSRTRIAGVVALGLLGAVAPHVHGAGAEHLHRARRAGRGHRRLPDRADRPASAP